jgi:hypothetical protein
VKRVRGEGEARVEGRKVEGMRRVQSVKELKQNSRGGDR